MKSNTEVFQEIMGRCPDGYCLATCDSRYISLWEYGKCVAMTTWDIYEKLNNKTQHNPNRPI